MMMSYILWFIVYIYTKVLYKYMNTSLLLALHVEFKFGAIELETLNSSVNMLTAVLLQA